MDAEEEKTALARQGARAGLLNIGAAGISKLSNLLFYILVLRVITPEEGGLYFLSSTVANLIAVIGVFGMADSLARFIPYYEGAKKSEKIRPLVFTSLLSFALISAVILLVSLAGKDWISSNYSAGLANALLITLLMSVMFAANNLLISAFMGFKKFGEAALYSALQPVLRIILVIVLFLISARDLEAVLNATFYAAVIVNFAMLPSLVSSLIRFPAKSMFLAKSEIPAIFSYGTAAALNQFSSSIMGYTDTLVLAVYVSSAALGAYNAVNNMARTAMQTISAQIFMVLTSMLAHLHGAKSDVFGPLASNAARWSAYITIPVAVLCVMFAREFTAVLFPAYIDYYWLFYVFVPGLMISMISFPARSSLSAVGRADLIFKSTALGLIPNVGLNLLLIPPYGIWGAVLATVISFTASELVAIYYSMRYAKFELHPMLWNTLAPTAAMCVALPVSYRYLFDFSSSGIVFEAAGVGFASLFSLSLYFIFLVKLGGFNRTDYGLIDRIADTAKAMAGLGKGKKRQ